MPEVQQIGIGITADDRASKTLQAVTAEVLRLETGISGLSATTIVKGGVIVGGLLAVGAAAAKMAEQGVRAAADLQHSVASISTIKPDMDTSAVFKSLNNLQTQVPQTAKQLGDSLYDVFSSIDNVTQEQGLKLVETFAKGATAAQTDAKTFGTAISGVLNAYKLDTSEATKVSDVFFNTVNRGVVTGPQLAAGLGPAIAAAKAMGVSYEEAFALVVGATKEGGDAAQNINNITNLLSKLPTKEATVDLNALGIATQDVAGNLRKPIDVLTDLKAKLDTMGEAARATVLLQIFPDLQARQGAQVIMSQLDTVKTALAENRTETNSTAEAYRKMAATAVEQGKLLQNTWTALLTDMSAVALPGLVAALGLVGAGVRDLRVTFENVSTAVGDASTTIQTKTTEIKGDLDTLTTYADTNLRPQWDAFWKAATGGNYQMPPLPTPPPAPTPQQQEGAAGLGPTTPQYVPGVTPAPLEQTRSPFGGAGAGHLSPEESGLGPLGNIRGQSENVLQDMADSNAAHATAMGDTLAENFASELNRRRPAMHDAGVELGDAVGEGVAAGVETAAPAARSAALIEQDLADARKRATTEALGGTVAVRAHTEELERERVAALGGYAAMQQHEDALNREKTAALGGQVAIRARTEALEAEKVADLGGALAIQAHDDQRNREKEATLGGQLAIRARTEALEAEKVADLGGYAAMQQHDDERAREKTLALGGEIAIRARTEALADEKVADLGGYQAMQQHDDERNREKTAALGGEVGIRAHTEALNEEKIAALGGRAAILDHQAALQKLDIQAQQSQTVFATLADKMANWAKQGFGDPTMGAAPDPTALVNMALNYKSQLSAIDQATSALINNSQKAEIDVLKNSGDLWGALDLAIEKAGLGYQDVAGLINGERDATERLNTSIQQNVAHRQAQLAAEKALSAGQKAAIIDTAGGTPQVGVTGTPAGALAGTGSPFADPEFAAWYKSFHGDLEKALTEGKGTALSLTQLMGEFAAAQRAHATELARAQEAQVLAMEKAAAGVDRAGEKLAARLQTTAQQAAAFAGVPSYQSTYDTLAQQQATTQLSALTATMPLAQRAMVEFTAATQGPVAALNQLGQAVNTSGVATQGATAATTAHRLATVALTTDLTAMGFQVTAMQGMFQANIAAGQDWDTASANAADGLARLQQGFTAATQVFNQPDVSAAPGYLGMDPVFQAIAADGTDVSDTLREVAGELQAASDQVEFYGAAVASASRATSAATLAAQAESEKSFAAATGQLQSNEAVSAAMQKAGHDADSLGQGLDFAGAAAARAGLAALDMTHNTVLASAAAQAAAEGFKAAAATAQALMAGQMRNAGVAGGVTQVGQTYGQIYGSQTPGSSSGITTLTPGNYFGLPVVSGSPLTQGILRGYADGGMVYEPHYLVNARSGQTSGIMAERGPERIGGGGGTIVVQMPVTITGSDALRDPRLFEQLLDRGLTQAMKKRGLI